MPIMPIQNIAFEIVTDSIERAVEMIDKIELKKFHRCTSITIRIVDECKKSIGKNNATDVSVQTNADDDRMKIVLRQGKEKV